MTHTPPPPAPNTDPNPILLNEAQLDALLRRASLYTAVIGLIAALGVWIGSGWRSAVMVAVGAGISVASILEWQRLTRLMNARMKAQRAQRGAALVVTFFLVRLLIFALVIYGSLKVIHGSFFALVFGLSLAVLTLFWEAIKLFRK